MNAEELFGGIVVVIDDEIDQQSTSIKKIIGQVEAKNCHVISLNALPPKEKFSALSNASFFILDWNLHDAEEKAQREQGVQTPAALKKSRVDDTLTFLKAIRDIAPIPIFIFTAENVDEVKGILKKAELLKDDAGDHIFVKEKSGVDSDGEVFKTLEDWIKHHPAAYVLKQWEQAYTKAKDSLFRDFLGKSRFWPVVLWKNYKDDSIDGSAELTAAIARNILSRLAPVPFEPSIVMDQAHVTAAASIPTAELTAVMEGERFIEASFLQPESVAPGDVFKKNGNFYVNVRPECDCIARDGQDVQLYLLKGDKFQATKSSGAFDETFGKFKDDDISCIVFPIIKGKSIRFKFKNFEIVKWADWKSNRVGRLMPPYSTMLQQRFAAFIQRIGLSRIPTQSIEYKIEATQGPQT